jgi:hypothetical protein
MRAIVICAREILNDRFQTVLWIRRTGCIVVDGVFLGPYNKAYQEDALMSSPVIIRGMFCNKTFVPADPLPEAEGPAELIVHVQLPKGSRPSIYDAFGKVGQPRTAEDLDAQLDEGRAAWGDP